MIKRGFYCQFTFSARMTIGVEIYQRTDSNMDLRIDCAGIIVYWFQRYSLNSLEHDITELTTPTQRKNIHWHWDIFCDGPTQRFGLSSELTSK